MPRRRATLSLLTAAATLLATATSATAATAEGPERREAASITVTGKGWGHGKGLSQYGARNRANAGQRYGAIIRFYYPGTRLGTTSGAIKILISGDTTQDVRVRARTGLRLRSLGAGKTWRLPAKYQGRKITAWRIVPAAGQRSRVQHHAGRWRDWRSPRGDAEFTAGGAPMMLVTPSGAAAYRGSLRSTSANPTGSVRDTVNVVAMESYLRGVVPEEMPASWAPAAVQAQAVAARTYAAFERRDHRSSRHYDLCDTTRCQVYRGYDEEDPDANAAIRATAGKIVTYGGRAAFTQFSASNGGYTAPGDFDYLKASRDTFDRGYPGDPWTRTFTGPQVTRHWPGLGDLESVEVTDTDASHRVTQLRVTGSDGAVTVDGSDFASYLGLRSTLFTVS